MNTPSRQVTKAEYDLYHRQVESVAASIPVASVTLPKGDMNSVFGDMAATAGHDYDQATRQTQQPQTQTQYRQSTQPAGKPRTKTEQAAQPFLQQPLLQTFDVAIPPDAPELEVKESMKDQAARSLEEFKQKLNLGIRGRKAKKLLLGYVFLYGTSWTGSVLPLLIVLPPANRMHLLIVLVCIAASASGIGYMWDSKFLLKNGLLGLVSLAAIYFFHQTFLVTCRLPSPNF